MSEAYIRYARQRASDDRVRFQVGDAGALPFAADTFQGTLSLLVFNFLPDPAAALREMVRVTRSNGVVAVAVWDYGDGMQMLRAFWNEAAALDPAAAARRTPHAIVSARRVDRPLASARAGPCRRGATHHQDDLPVVRRLLAARPARAGTCRFVHGVVAGTYP